MRIGILALLQESNTFTPGVTRMADFAADLMLTGEEVREQLAGAHHEIGGYFAGLADAGAEAAPIIAARAVPWGPIEQGDFQKLMTQMRVELERAGPLDGLLLAAHGATVSEQIPDVDGYWLGEVRRFVGPATPIVGTLDPHANLSPTMVAACDALLAYRTNPHLDQRERGSEAAELVVRTVRGEIRPTMAAAFPPVAINIQSQSTAESPCREWFEQLSATRELAGVLTGSLLLGFPYADVAELGSATIVVTDNDPALAQREANRLAMELWNKREAFNRRPTPLAEAAQQARRLAGPVGLLDIGDNIGGGGPGDSTHLLHALAEANVAPRLACLNDPTIAERAHQMGVGRVLQTEVGGRSSPLAGAPLRGDFTVRALSAGKFSESRPRHGGFVEFDQGPTAVLESADGATLIVTSKRTPPFSLAQITSCGVDPTKFQAIIAKGVHAPIAAYREVCREFVRVDTPGVTTAEMTSLPFHNRRTPLYPFEQDFTWSAAEV